MIGIPIELFSTFPNDAPIILLTESAKSDPNVITNVKAQLETGKTVVMTSGLLRVLEGKGIEDLVELRTTGMHEPVTSFTGAFGPASCSPRSVFLPMMPGPSFAASPITTPSPSCS